MTKTRAELIGKALSVLEVVGSGQSPSAEDYATVNAVVDPVLARLTAREIIGNVDPDHVPDEYFLPLAVLVGDGAAIDFGIARGLSDDPDSWASKVARAEAELRDMTASRPTYEVAAPEFF